MGFGMSARGVKRTSFSGGWMSACSHKRGAYVQERRLGARCSHGRRDASRLRGLLHRVERRGREFAKCAGGRPPMPPKSIHAKAPRPCDRAAAERQQSDRWVDCHPKRRPAPMLSGLAMGGGGNDTWSCRRDTGDGDAGKGRGDCRHGFLPAGLTKGASSRDNAPIVSSAWIMCCRQAA